MQRALQKTGDVLGDTPIECIHYNAAKASRTTLLEESVNDLRANLEVRSIEKSENTHEFASDVWRSLVNPLAQISVIGLYTVAKWAIPRLLLIAGDGCYKPAFLVTSGWLAHDRGPQ